MSCFADEETEAQMHLTWSHGSSGGRARVISLNLCSKLHAVLHPRDLGGWDQGR